MTPTPMDGALRSPWSTPTPTWTTPGCAAIGRGAGPGAGRGRRAGRGHRHDGGRQRRGRRARAAQRGIFAAVGIHPNEAAGATEADWAAILDLAEQPEVVAIGETGLDRYWDRTPFDVQQEWFGRHLELAHRARPPGGDPLPRLCRAT